MSTLYIRHPARAEGEGAPCRFALVGDGGTVEQQGEGALRTLTDIVAASRRVVLLLAGTDVNLLSLAMPPLTGARLRAALPGLVEEHVLGDPDDCVLVAGPPTGDGSRPVAVVARDWFEPLVRTLLAQGAHAVTALPAQLCLPLQPGSVSAALNGPELLLRRGQFSGLGLALDANPASALQTARALAGDAPLTLYVPREQLGEYGVLLAEAGPGTVLEADDWAHWIAGAKTLHSATNFDLVPGLGSAGARQTDWRRWRWAIAMALLGVAVNLAGMNIEWLRLRGEADAVRKQMAQTFQSVYPNQPMVDPVAQMRQSIARAQASSGQIGADEFIYLAGALGDASRELTRPPGITSIEYKERALRVRVKPDTVDPASLRQLQAALTARSLSLEAAAPDNWVLRSAGAKP